MEMMIKPGPRAKRGVGRQGSKALGRLIRTRREMLGMSQEEFAQRVGFGSRGTISPIESGSRSLTAEDKVRRVAELIGEHPDRLYTIQGYIPHDVYDAIAGLEPEAMARLRAWLGIGGAPMTDSAS